MQCVSIPASRRANSRWPGRLPGTATPPCPCQALTNASTPRMWRSVSPRAPPVSSQARRTRRRTAGATSISSATKGSSEAGMPLARDTSSRSSCMRAGSRPPRLSSEARSRRNSAWRWLRGKRRSRVTSRSRRTRSCSRSQPESHSRACSCSTVKASTDIRASPRSGASASVTPTTGSSRSWSSSRRASRSSRTTCSCSIDWPIPWIVEPPAARCAALAASRSEARSRSAEVEADSSAVARSRAARLVSTASRISRWWVRSSHWRSGVSPLAATP